MTKTAKINSIKALQELISNSSTPSNATIYSKLDESFAKNIRIEIQKLIRSNYSVNRSISLEFAALGSLLGVSSSDIFGNSTVINKNQAIDLLNKIIL